MYCILKFVNCIAVIVRNLSLSFFYVKFKIMKHFVYRCTCHPSRAMLFNEIQSSKNGKLTNKNGNIIAFEVPPFYILHYLDDQTGSLFCVTKRFVNISLLSYCTR